MSAIDPKNAATWPVDPKSSAGKRLEDHKTPAAALSEMEMWFDILPPPRQGYVDEDDVLMWIREVAAAGAEHADESRGISAIAAVTYVQRPEIFPHGPALRGRCQHLFGNLLRELDDAAKKAREDQARAKASDDHNALRELKRQRGWL